MKNNKGFTLIELLAVITIIGILAGLGVTGYTRYIYYTRNKAYNTMAKSAANAAEEYAMDNIGVDEVTLKELSDNEYLDYPYDPAEKNKLCTGKVNIVYKSNDTGLDEEEYDVTICCANYSYKYHFPGGSKVLANDSCPIE